MNCKVTIYVMSLEECQVYRGYVSPGGSGLLFLFVPL